MTVSAAACLVLLWTSRFTDAPCTFVGAFRPTTAASPHRLAGCAQRHRGSDGNSYDGDGDTCGRHRTPVSASNVAVPARSTATCRRRTRLASAVQAFQGDDSVYFDPQQYLEPKPMPPMPSQQFFRMAKAQLELLANSLIHPGEKSVKKIHSMGLYLPQENASNGQLEFTPVVLHPDPASERVFIASEANSGVPPSLPPALTKLPGFETAVSLLPGYPMISADASAPAVGVIEEVMCDPTSRHRAASLSVPLLSGPQTVGVLLVSPSSTGPKARKKSRQRSDGNKHNNASSDDENDDEPFWTEHDRAQISVAAQSLSIALSMDNERSFLKQQNREIRESLSNSLHQVKNPIQALRMYGKLLERRITTEDLDSASGKAPNFFAGRRGNSLMDLTNNLMIQSERIADLLQPIDTLVDRMDALSTPYLIGPSTNATTSNVLAKASSPSSSSSSSLVLLQQAQASSSQLIDSVEDEALEYARINATLADDLYSTDVLPSAHTTPSSQQQQPPQQGSMIEIFGGAEREMTFLTELLERTLTSFYTTCKEHEVAFTVIEEDDDLPGISVAPKALQEALTNLLDNALKYVVVPKPDSPFTSNPSPKIRVRFRSNSRDDGEEPGVTILIEDNGPGISDVERDLVFRRGYRSPRTDSIAGTGIGLDIAHSLISDMGGKLTVLDETDSSSLYPALDGTTMKVVLYRSPVR